MPWSPHLLKTYITKIPGILHFPLAQTRNKNIHSQSSSGQLKISREIWGLWPTNLKDAAPDLCHFILYFIITLQIIARRKRKPDEIESGGGGQGMVRSLCRINLPTSAQTHSTCLRHLLSIKCTKFRQLVLVNPRHNGRSRKGERTTYPYLLPCTRALVRRGDEDGDRRMQQDESKDTDEKILEKPKRMVAKHSRRPMR